jgi:hypothetical protein
MPGRTHCYDENEKQFSAPPGSGREKTADDSSDRFQLLGSRVRLYAGVLERGRAEQVERIRRGEDDGARKRFVQLWDRQHSLPERSPITPAIRENQFARSQRADPNRVQPSFGNEGIKRPGVNPKIRNYIVDKPKWLLHTVTVTGMVE